MKLKREAFGECIAEVAAKAGVDEDAAFGILQTVADHGERMRAAGKPNPFNAAAEDIAAKAKESAAQDRADALRNLVVRNNILADIRSGGGIGAAEQELRSLLHGTNKGGRESVQAAWRGHSDRWTGVLSAKLRQLGLEHAAISGDLDKEVSEALWAMNAKTDIPSAVSKPARDIAAAIKPMLDLAKDRLNAAGAHIGDATDFVSHTSHDPVKMRRAAGAGESVDSAFKAWWDFTKPNLAEKTFEDVLPREGESPIDAQNRFGRSVYEALVSGVHMTQKGLDGVDPAADARVPPSYEGGHNIARSISQQRVLFWKDGAAWNSYAERFGRSQTLTQGVMNSLDRGGRDLALMETFGTNPAGNLQMVIRKVQEEYRGDLDGLAAFRKKVPGLENVMGRLDGSLNIPHNEQAAAINANFRTWESVADLGGVGITHFASIWPTVTSELAHHGVGRLETVGRLIEALTTGKGDAERQEILGDLGAYAGGLNRDIQSKWQADTPIPGKVSGMANTFMKYTGIHYVFDRTQAAVRELLSSQLGRSAGTAFGELNANLQMILGKYGLGEKEWDLLRASPDMPTSQGRTYMTPSVAYKTDPAAIEALLRSRGELAEDAPDDMVQRGVQHFQWGLADKLSAYYSDAAAHSVVTAGVKERAFILGSSRPGSFTGELLRYLAQFKMWPLAALDQVLGREIYMSTSKGQAAFNIGTMIALSTAGGYMRMAINDAARGHPQRNPMDPRTLMAALAQGGGIGIVGDFLFGESNRMGTGPLATLAGPVLTDVGSLYGIFNRFREDSSNPDPDERAKAIQHVWPDLLRFGVSHVPFANLVYLKGALDYMLLYHMYEAASPGWWNRTSARVEKETGRTMAGYTPGGGIPYGVPGLYLGGNGAPPSGILAGQQH